MVTVKELKEILKDVPDDALLHMCVDEWEYAPIIEVMFEKYEPEDVGFVLFRPDPKSAI